MLQQLCNDDYYGKYKRAINLGIFPAGNLGTSGVVMLSITSGSPPDVILGGNSNLAKEYGMRGAVVDLKQFPDIEKVGSRFLPGLTRAFTFKDSLFALPETMEFNVLFYRSDIMKELSLPIPDTWEELYSKVLPALKKNGLDFWYESGINTFLYQMSGDY